MKRRLRGGLVLLPLVVILVLATGGWALAATGDTTSSSDQTTTTDQTGTTGTDTTTADATASADPSATDTATPTDTASPTPDPTTDPTVAPEPTDTPSPDPTTDPSTDPSATDGGTATGGGSTGAGDATGGTTTGGGTGKSTSDSAQVTGRLWASNDPSVTSVPAAGNSVLYTYGVHNDTNVALTISSLKDSAFGVLNGDKNCKVGTVLDAGASCSFKQSEWVQGPPGGYLVNTFTVVADHGDQAFSACETAIVHFGAQGSGGGEGELTVRKTAAQSTAIYTGQDMKFWFTITNGTTEDVTITSIVDDVFGKMAGDSDCKVGTVLVAGDICTFSYTAFISGPVGSHHINTVTVVAEHGQDVFTASDSATVTFVTGESQLEVTKTANKHEVDTTGGNVTFTFDVENTGEQDVEIVSIHDSVFGALAGDSDCQVGTVLAPHTGCQFELTAMLKGAAGTHHVNTVTVVGKSNGHFLTACDTETVTFVEEVLGTHHHKPSKPPHKPQETLPTAFTGASLGFAPLAALVLLFVGTGLLLSVRRRGAHEKQ